MLVEELPGDREGLAELCERCNVARKRRNVCGQPAQFVFMLLVLFASGCS